MMKAKSIGKLMEKWDVIRNHRRSSAAAYEEDGVESHSRRPWRFSTSYRESLSPTFSENSLLLGRDKFLSCVKFTARRSNKNLVTVLVGKDRQAFQVEPQILDHGIVQCLLEKTRAGENQRDLCDFTRLRAGESPLFEEDICLDCDAILFDHILWLLNNDDPSLRNFNLDELMEFYT